MTNPIIILRIISKGTINFEKIESQIPILSKLDGDGKMMDMEK